MKTYRITLLPGDGIGPEILEQAAAVLLTVGENSGVSFSLSSCLFGGAAIDACGCPLPEETLRQCLDSDAVLLGAVGGPQWDSCAQRPEAGLLSLRRELGVYANLRPVRLIDSLRSASPLKEDVLQDGLDLMIVRELTGGIYFGSRGVSEDGKCAFDTEWYSEAEIQRVCHVAFRLARRRRRKLCLVDKANVLESSRLWRRIFGELSERYPDVETEALYVDNAAMQLIRDPSQFDVLVTSNLFGDILSDEASMLVGSIGLLPSGSLGDGTFGLYEPIHGSAPDLAGQNVANPFAAILSVAMMLEASFGLETESRSIWMAVERVLKNGYRTRDIAGGVDQTMVLGTREMGSKVIGELMRGE